MKTERATLSGRAFTSFREEAAYIFFVVSVTVEPIFVVSVIAAESVVAGAAGAVAAASAAGAASSAFGAQAANTIKDATTAKRFIGAVLHSGDEPGSRGIRDGGTSAKGRQSWYRRQLGECPKAFTSNGLEMNEWLTDH